LFAIISDKLHISDEFVQTLLAPLLIALRMGRDLTLILLTCRIWWAPNNASRWQMGFNSAFKGL